MRDEFLCRIAMYINDIYKLYPKIAFCGENNCHSHNNTYSVTQNDPTNDQDSTTFIWVVLFFYLAIFVKIAIILIYFVMYSVTVKLWYYIISLFESRCLHPKKIIPNCCNYLWIIIKKFYM